MTHTLANPTQAKSLFSAPFSHSPGFPSIRRKHTLLHSLAPINKRPAQTLHDELNQHIAVKGCTRLTIIVPFPHPTLSSFISTNFHNTHAELSVFGFTWLKLVKFSWLNPHFISFHTFLSTSEILLKNTLLWISLFSLPVLSSFFLADH